MEARKQTFALLLLLALAWPQVGASGSGAENFTLTVEEDRVEIREVGLSAAPVEVEMRSALTLYGRIAWKDGRYLTFNDSLVFTSDYPAYYRSFMSADTMYAASKLGTKGVAKGGYSVYDSLLLCLFTGPALEYRPALKGASRIRDLKRTCSSGEYTRLNPPVSLGAFLLPPLTTARDSCTIALPSFSGLRFFPSIRVERRRLERGPAETTVVLLADTTFKDRQVSLGFGDTFVILEDKIHLGGSMIMAPGEDIPRRGEVRVEEKISYLHQRSGATKNRKNCFFILRFKRIP